MCSSDLGVKFKDADLVGVPYRVTLGKKISEGVVELFFRDTKHREDLKLGEIVEKVRQLVGVHKRLAHDELNRVRGI